jgi:hypothetical protein
VPGQPEHMAVTWQLGDMPQPVTECIQRLGSDGNPGRVTVQQVGPAYSGFWYAPVNSGWGYQALVDAVPSSNLPTAVPTFRESNIVSLYDTTGKPVWFSAGDAAATLTPPPLAVKAFPMKYVHANYDVRAAVVTCTSNCVSEIGGNVLAQLSQSGAGQGGCAGGGKLHACWAGAAGGEFYPPAGGCA